MQLWRLLEDIQIYDRRERIAVKKLAVAKHNSESLLYQVHVCRIQLCFCRRFYPKEKHEGLCLTNRTDFNMITNVTTVPVSGGRC